MRERVLSVFMKTFDLPKDIDTATLIYNEFKGWDSVAHMSLVAALEGEFDCMLEMDDILAMSSFDRAIEIMERAVSAT